MPKTTDQQREYNRAYYQKNKQRLLERQRAYYYENREHEREYKRARRGHINEMSKSWRDRNPEKIRAYNERYSEYRRAWYERNIERTRASSRAKRAERLALVHAFKSRPCADCGNQYPPEIMDLDHVRGEKSGNVSLLVGKASVERILAELDKCEVRCANCHRMRHLREKEAAKCAS